MGIGCHQWALVVISGYWLSLVGIGGYQWVFVVVSRHWWLSLQ